jgi:hypothetical protein
LNHSINQFEPLLSRIEDQSINQLIKPIK